MLTIAHTNDLHNQVGMLPRLAALIARERDARLLLVECGDLALDDSLDSLGLRRVRAEV